MSTRTLPSLRRVRPRRETLLWGAFLVNTEIILLLGYAWLSNTQLLSFTWLRLWVYPFVWINVGLWALFRADLPTADRRTRAVAGLVAVGYLAVLSVVGGVVGGGGGELTSLRFVLMDLPPGWAPAVNYVGPWLSVTLITYRVFGYLVLAYLVYGTVLDAASSAVTGVVGLLSCVSCSWPVLASLVTGVAGSGSGLAVAVESGSYGISTVVFVVTVVLLTWRPLGD